MQYCLGVESSITGKQWRLETADDRLATAISQQLNLPEIVGRLLALRGIDMPQAADFLKPSLSALPDPLQLRDMDKAVDALLKAVQNSEIVGVFGDYDVDGATSAALLVNYLNAIGIKTIVHIPDRKSEGYGPNIAALTGLAAQGAKTIVTVDCGVTAHQVLDDAEKAGLEIVVIDHHQASPELPRARAVVNPNRVDEDFPHKNLAACGVTFMVLVALNRALRQAGFFAQRAEPDLRLLLDLVALGTVADVVPLTGLNRLFVSKGLEVMGQRHNIGLRALSEVARLKERPDSYHLGFLLGPRVNAGGRIGSSGLGVQLLTTKDEFEARRIAEELDRLNAERQKLESAMVAEAIQQADLMEHGDVVVVANKNWHPGVIGIAASRLKERYHRPACVIALEKGDDGEFLGTGSARSITGFDIGRNVLSAVQKEILKKGGGHAMAAGFTVLQKRIPDFQMHLQSSLNEQTKAEDLLPSLRIDGCLSVEAANQNLIAKLEQIAPFGTSNPQPRFAFDQVKIAYADVVGEKHVRCTVESASGAKLKAIAFKALETPLGAALLKSKGQPLKLAGQLKPDNFGGRNAVQLIIDDAA